MIDYLADLNQSVVFYNLSSKLPDNLEWGKLREHIIEVLSTADISSESDFEVYVRLFKLVWNKADIPISGKLIMKIRYGKSDIDSVIDSLESPEAVDFIKYVLSKREKFNI
jgi:hypothetical protein